MTHYRKLTAVVMGHLIADDGSGNRFSTSGHIVITRFINKSISYTAQPPKWSCVNFQKRYDAILQFLASCEDNEVGG